MYPVCTVPTPLPVDTPLPEPTSSPTPTPLTAVKYLQKIAEADAPVDKARRAVDTALFEAAEVSVEVLALLEETGFGEAQDTLLKAITELEPPGELRADHEAYIRWLGEAGVPLSSAVTIAIDGGDLTAVVLTLAEFDVSRFTLLSEVSSAFCRTLNPDDDLIPPNDHFCGDDRPLPGGGYGVQLRAVMEKLVAGFVPRTGVLRPALTESEQMDALSTVQPDIISLFEDSLETARGLRPPTDLQQDHNRTVQLLEETLTVARDIMQAAEARDFESLIEQFRRSLLYAESAERALSPAIRPLVSPLFGEAPPDQVVLSKEEADYLDKLDTAVSAIEDKFGKVGRALSQSYPTRERLLSALAEADVSGAVEALSDQLSSTDPPERFRPDHEALVAMLESLPTAGRFDELLEKEDLVAISLARKDFLLGMGRVAQQSSRPFCDTAAFGNPETVCDDDVPGGEYGVALRRALNHTSVEFGPRVSSFPLGLSTEEVFAALEILQPEII